MQLTDLRPLIAGEVPNCPNPVMDRALIDAARELCTGATLWMGTTTVSSVDVDDPTDLSDPSLFGLVNAEIVYVVTVMADGRPFRDVRMVSNSKIWFLSDPGSIVVNASFRPAAGATSLPDELDRYRDGVLSGALWRLLRMNAQPWSNPDLALYHGRKARESRNQAIYDVQRGRAYGDVRAAARPFARF